jgi:predicted neuraminidase
MVNQILDLRSMELHGELFRSPADGNRVEAFIPPLGKENHASNFIEMPNGDILCTWFTGSAEGNNDVRIAISRLPYQSAQWTQPVFVSEDSTRSEQNPVLFLTPDGELWLMYSAQETRGCTKEEWERRTEASVAEGSYTMQWTAVIRRRISKDNDHTWGPVEDYFNRPSSFCRQLMVVMSNVEWMFPMYYSLLSPSHGEDFSVMQISKDSGKSWNEIPVPGSRGRVQPTVLELTPGRLVSFFRSRAADRIYVSHSTDYGKTWTVPERTMLLNNNASIQATLLASGHIAMVFNNFSANDDPTKTIRPRERYPVTVAISEDGGNTWPYMRNIDAGDEMLGEKNKQLNRRCGYPSIMQTRDGFIHIGYSYRPRQCIKYVRITENWIRGQLDTIWEQNPGASTY